MNGWHTGYREKMNDIFAHCLEDEWDCIFLTLTPEQQNFVLRELRDSSNNSSSLPTIDDAFEFIMKESNEHFHKFAQTLTEQVKVFVVQ